jgi:transposase-like protein
MTKKQKKSTKGDSTMKKITALEAKRKEIEEILGREGGIAIEELHRAGQEELIQRILDVEVEEYLGRKWHKRCEKPTGYRNGYYKSTIAVPGERLRILKPHFRKTDKKFKSRILEGVVRLSEKLKTMAVEMYVRGLSTRDIEETLKEANGKPMFSRSMVSKLSERLYEQYREFSERDLSNLDVVYLFADGVYESVRRYTNNQALLCAWAICSDGSKHLLHIAAVESESVRAWEEFFENMKRRGLRQPLLVISDGGKAILAALEKCFPKADRQRCIAHKLRNIASKLPRDVQKLVLEEVKAVYYAPNRAAADMLATQIIERYAKSYPSAIACFTDDLDACLTHLKYPAGHRRFIRTTNLLERSFEEQKRRTKVFPQHQHESSCLGLVFAVLKRASDKWQRVSMTELELVQLRNIRALICANDESNNYISYQLAA